MGTKNFLAFVVPYPSNEWGLWFYFNFNFFPFGHFVVLFNLFCGASICSSLFMICVIGFFYSKKGYCS